MRETKVDHWIGLMLVAGLVALVSGGELLVRGAVAIAGGSECRRS